MGNFYHVFIQPKPGVSSEQVEKVMNLSVDWFRCTPSVWVLYSTSRIEKWRERLRPLVDPSGCLFICRLDMTKHIGFMKKFFWDWIEKNEDRPQQ